VVIFFVRTLYLHACWQPRHTRTLGTPPIFFHAAFYCRKQLISQLLGKISKIWLVNFEPLIWWFFLPNFSPLASLVWPENEVTAGQMNAWCHAIFLQTLYKNGTNHNDFSKLPPSLCLRGITLLPWSISVAK